MASSKIVALLFAFAVVTVTLPPSAAARAQAFKPADDNQDAPAQPLSDGASLHPSASGGSPAAPAMPGIPAGLLPLIGLLFPPLGIGGLIAGLIPQPGGSPAAPPQPTECMTPLMGMMPCTDYLTNLTVLTPPGACCDGLKSVISAAPICLCHGMNGDLNRFLPKPVDPVRMLVLPLACGTALPLQTLFACSSHQVPPIMPPVPAQPPATPSASP
ncbi:hypothetical protein EJB05_36094 [Eragrostis curvula]|uniref:Bifunctional inhibitor/plant lipid transfer protein/seed storage helical domain-containing protein n=1 Tax=Eragrostis curvula TaxID=38414 RepID=A0A5J9U877_9POAL|nr:hypothetical protein EJB05_36094 [Eragrostis curvula]